MNADNLEFTMVNDYNLNGHHTIVYASPFGDNTLLLFRTTKTATGEFTENYVIDTSSGGVRLDKPTQRPPENYSVN